MPSSPGTPAACHEGKEGFEVRFDAVFFDAGETMIHPEPSFPELFSMVLAEAGRHVDPEKVLETVSVYSQRFADLSTDRKRVLWSTSAEKSRAFWLELYGDFLGEVGVNGDRAALAEALYVRFSDPGSYVVYPDVVPALQALQERGARLGVISNFEEWLELVLEAHELTPYFPVRVISGAVGVEKPDPEIFRVALERLKVDAKRAVYVGDHPYFDVEASEAVGMTGVLVDRRGRYPDHEGLKVDDLRALAATLETA